MSIGYATVNSILFNFSGEIQSKTVNGIFITEIEYESDINADLSKSKVLSAYQTNLNSKVVLSQENINSTITYKIKISNTNNYDFVFEKTDFILGNETYDNDEIIFELDGLNEGDIFPKNSDITFYITFKYNTLAISKNELNSILNFKFIVKPYIVAEYDYSGDVENFIAPRDGVYQIELWGAQGGSDITHSLNGGYGAYSVGELTLTKGQQLFVAVGGAGTSTSVYNDTIPGGFNGGGASIGWWASHSETVEIKQSGGGATHISTENKVISETINISSIIAVAAGGSGASYLNTPAREGWEDMPSILYAYCSGGHGGGITGGISNCDSNLLGYLFEYSPATQTSGGYSKYNESVSHGSFGKGSDQYAGGGGGWYGGAGSYLAAGGGSSFINNSLLTNKHMTCYQCETSTIEKTKTLTTNNVSEQPISNYAKIGNGYAKITLIKLIDK